MNTALGHSVGTSPFAMTGVANLLRNSKQQAAFGVPQASSTSTNGVVYTAPFNPNKTPKKQRTTKKQQTKTKTLPPSSSSIVLSDFNFSSPTFTNFRLDYQQILSAF